jgi:hypothetical protein
MVTFGGVLLVIGILAGISTLTIAMILMIAGALLWLLDATDRAVSGRWQSWQLRTSHAAEVEPCSGTTVNQQRQHRRRPGLTQVGRSHGDWPL